MARLEHVTGSQRAAAFSSRCREIFSRPTADVGSNEGSVASLLRPKLRAVATLKRMSDAWKPTLRKVCGITRPADARLAVRAGANAVGMVFYSPSPRSVTARQAEHVASAIPEGIRRVGVFVSERPDVILSAIERARLTVVQLHGEESAEDCATVRRAVGDSLEIWKAVHVGPGFEGVNLSEFAVDAFLLDTARERAYGGTGKAFPWHLALRAKPFGKVVLAGGLDGGNVARAVRVVRPWGVDSSSRLEDRPGVKDPDKVTRFLDAVR